MTAGWVDLAPVAKALRGWLETTTGRPCGWNRVPAGAAMPYSVLQVIATPRLFVALRAGQVVTVVAQVTSVGGDTSGRPLPEQAMMLADRVSAALVGTDGDGGWLHAISLPGCNVIGREASGDGHPDDSDQISQWVESYRLTLTAA